jgi:hypothetical protein
LNDDDDVTDTASDELPERESPARSQTPDTGTHTSAWIPVVRNAAEVFWTGRPDDKSIRHALFVSIQMALSLRNPVFLGLVDHGYSSSTTPLPWDQQARQQLALSVCTTLLIAAYSLKTATVLDRLPVLNEYFTQLGVSIRQNRVIEMCDDQTDSGVISIVHAYDLVANRIGFAVEYDGGPEYHRFLSTISKEIYGKYPPPDSGASLERDITHNRCCVVVRLRYAGHKVRLFDGVGLMWQDLLEGISRCSGLSTAVTAPRSKHKNLVQQNISRYQNASSRSPREPREPREPRPMVVKGPTPKTARPTVRSTSVPGVPTIVAATKPIVVLSREEPALEDALGRLHTADTPRFLDDSDDEAFSRLADQVYDQHGSVMVELPDHTSAFYHGTPGRDTRPW